MAISHTPQYGNLVVGGTGGGGYTVSPGSGAGTVMVSSGTGSTNWATNVARTTAKGQMHLEGPDADLVINNKSLGEWMRAVEHRLTILQPKPELLEKYENLRQAYEHYKTLEALLYDDQKPNK